MRIFILSFIALIFIGCNNSSTDNLTGKEDTVSKGKTTDENNIPTKTDDVSGCYMHVLQRDTLVINLQQNGNALSGKLTFDNYQIDGSSGTVNGKKEGDILKLEYAFFSEGMHSTMDVYFKLEDDKLIRGIGEMNTKRDTAYFVNPGNVEFSNGTILQKISCNEIQTKYR